jgi:hypothetical protein
MLKKIAVAISLAAACVVGAAGCGGGDETSSTSTGTATVTKASFIKQGDVVLCTKSEAVAVASASIDPKSPSRQELKDLVLKGVLPAAQTAHDDLASLDRPAGDEEQITAFLAELQSTIDATEANPALLVTGPDPFTKADKLLLAYGLHECVVS